MLSKILLRNTLEISIATLKSNLDIISRRISFCRIMAVLKSNAYGLGAFALAKNLHNFGLRNFGVSSLQEAIELSSLAESDIHLLGAFFQQELPLLIDNDIILPINSFDQAVKISEIAQKKQKKTRVQLLIDTGMGRLGISLAQAKQQIDNIIHLPNLEVIGIYSHFPHAYEDVEFSIQQVNDFKDLLEQFKHINFQNIHIANSDAILNEQLAISYQQPFNMVRVGISLYGCFDLRGIYNVMPLKKIFKLKSYLIEIKKLPKGSSIGYDRSYILQKDSQIGIVAIGYADGVPLALSYQNSYFKIRGKLVPIIGRVSMDYTTVDLTGIDNVQIGDEVLCLGEDLSIHTWAKTKKTITYDIICAIGNRVERVYL